MDINVNSPGFIEFSNRYYGLVDNRKISCFISKDSKSYVDESGVETFEFEVVTTGAANHIIKEFELTAEQRRAKVEKALKEAESSLTDSIVQLIGAY